MNTVLSVLKAANTDKKGTNSDNMPNINSNISSSKKAGNNLKEESPPNNLVSFSTFDEVGLSQSNNKDNIKNVRVAEVRKMSSDRAALFTSTERAVEVLAGMIGKTFVKEELVHGSHR